MMHSSIRFSLVVTPPERRHHTVIKQMHEAVDKLRALFHFGICTKKVLADLNSVEWAEH